METLGLKLALTPALIAVVSLAGRRWGPAVSGWLTGLPLTSGPVAVYLAIERGPAFAAAVAVGSISAQIAMAAFCLAWAALARRSGAAGCLLGALAVFLSVVGVLQWTPFGLINAVGWTLLAVVAAAWAMPRGPGGRVPATPAWDLPARMVVATSFVLLITSLADTLGPYLSGLLTSLPIFAGTLAFFTHRLSGPGAALGLLRGVLLGTLGYVAFFVAFSLTVVAGGIGVALLAAIAAAVATQVVTRRFVG